MRGAWLASTAVSFPFTLSPPWALIMSSGWRRVLWLGLGRSRWWIASRSSAPASWLGAPSPGGVYPPLSLLRAPRDPKISAAQEVPRVPTIQVLLIHPFSLRRRRRLETRSLHGGTIPREGRPVPLSGPRRSISRVGDRFRVELRAKPLPNGRSEARMRAILPEGRGSGSSPLKGCSLLLRERRWLLGRGSNGAT